MILETYPLGMLQTNCYFAAKDGASPLAVVDPGDDEAALLRALRGREVAGVLITHAHFDHILGLPALRGAPVYVHEADAPAMTDAYLSAAMDPARVPGVPATHTVREGDTVALGGLTFTVLHTPGHTPGSVCYLCGGVLFSGDTLFCPGYGRTDLPGGSMRQMYDSLRRLLALDGSLRVCPGHGESASLAEVRRRL